MENNFSSNTLLFIANKKNCSIFRNTLESMDLAITWVDSLELRDQCIKDFNVVIIVVGYDCKKLLQLANFYSNQNIHVPLLFIIDDNKWQDQSDLLNHGAFDVLLYAHAKKATVLQSRIDRALKYNKLVKDKEHCAELFERESKIKSRQLLHAHKLVSIGRIASQLAHDFNNQLMTIAGFSELALKELQNQQSCVKKISNYIETVKNAADKSASLSRDILSFSRKPLMEFNEIYLNSWVFDKVKTLSQVMDQKFKIKTNLAQINDKVYADSNQIEQLLYNLVLNARDAMPKGGVITIATSNTAFTKAAFKSFTVKIGSYVVLSISDTGEGMDHEQLKRIFEPYYTTKDHTKGTGLGLGTVFGIIKQHNGYIDVISEVDKGTRFDLYFPFVSNI